MKNKILSLIVYLILVPIVLLLGILVFKDRKYNIISMLIAFISCIPFFITFEKKKMGIKEVVCIAVMCALSILGRIVFMSTPGFKPVTAFVIISGIAFGSNAGFITGASSALVSNIYFGQGPWTPFQMFVWGFIGFISGIIFRKNKNPNIIILSIVGVLGGVLFSLMMDIWSTISFDGYFSIDRYFFYVLSSFSFMAIYAVSNVVFLLVLTKPILKKVNRIIDKYDLNFS